MVVFGARLQALSPTDVHVLFSGITYGEGRTCGVGLDGMAIAG